MADALTRQEGGSHYKDLAIQPVEYIHANGLGFCEGSVVKYVTRWRSKNGIQDLKKARHFLDLLIELEERKGMPAFVGVDPAVGPDRTAIAVTCTGETNGPATMSEAATAVSANDGPAERDCATCRHHEVLLCNDPCATCDGFSRWEPCS